MTTIELEKKTEPTPTRDPRWRAMLQAPSAAVASIWVSTALMSVFAPDMITGSEHEHLPMAALSVWLWASLATAYTLMGSRGTTAAPGLVVGVSAIWFSVLVATVASPLMVTGSDPTKIPMAVFIAPAVGAMTTGLMALHHATR